MATDPPNPARKRERSARYPGCGLAESVELARFVGERGLDGFPAPEIASALGYSSVRTNTFSARLSAARQFGLLTLKDEGYSLTPLARSILHPVDPAELPTLLRRAFLEPALYAELAGRFGGKPVPEASSLANLLYHQFQIIATAKDAAAETFLQSARCAGVLDEKNVLHPQGVAAEIPPPPIAPSPPGERPARGVRLDLHLWDDDAGKTIRLRAPESISRASFERFLQAFGLLVRVE